jgi:hypothetical protein
MSKVAFICQVWLAFALLFALGGFLRCQIAYALALREPEASSMGKPHRRLHRGDVVMLRNGQYRIVLGWETPGVVRLISQNLRPTPEEEIEIVPVDDLMGAGPAEYPFA